MTAPVDPRTCPLCGEANACGMAQGAGTCWCFATKVPKDVLERVPTEAQELACVCASCASGKRSPQETRRILDTVGRRR
jgi:hypothetical protein